MRYFTVPFLSRQILIGQEIMAQTLYYQMRQFADIVYIAIYGIVSEYRYDLIIRLSSVYHAEASYRLHRAGNGCYAFLIEGEAAMADVELAAQDAVGVTDAEEVTVRALAPARLLLVEVPMQNWKQEEDEA